MSILIWVILGLVAGALAKLIMPGKDDGGVLMTIALGIAGAVVGGWLGGLLGFGAVGGIGITSIITATLGALLILFVYKKIKK